MTRDYAPTAAPGDTRTRARYLGIRIPMDQQATVEILEQDVVRLADGETVLRDIGAVAGVPTLDLTDGAALGETFPLRDPATDGLTGQTATVGAAFQLIHSWVRHQQELRDAAETQP